MTASYITFQRGSAANWHKVLFGSGSDGDVTLAANTPLNGVRSYNNLTIPSGYEMRIYDYPTTYWNSSATSNWTSGTSGVSYTCFYFRVKDTLRIGGTLSGNGINGGWGGSNSRFSGFASSTNHKWGDLVPGNTGSNTTNYCGMGRNGSGALGADGTGAPIASLGVENFYCGGLGGNGGDATPNTGGAGNNGQTYYPFPHFLHDFNTRRPASTTYSTIYAGGCGGGGANNGTGDSGAGGSGGCSVVVYAKNIIIESTGIIQSNGGNGSTPTGTSAGGGGGGGGGVIALYYETLTIASGGKFYVNGGTGGTKTGTGTNGSNGSPGVIYTYNCLTGEFEDRSAQYT